MKMLSSVLSGMVIVLFSLNLAVAAPSNMQDSSRHLYDRVMEEFKHRDYEAALAGFRFFLELHGRSSLAANAQYWVGECQYRLGRYKDALKSFYHVDLEDRTNVYKDEGSRESSYDVRTSR
jgi:TolA-binding protein